MASVLPLYPSLIAFPPTWARRPQGMHSPENAVWQLFRAANAHQIRTLYFNVHCGTVPGLTALTDALENRTRSAIWAKRADVVAELDTETWIVEVKADVRITAIGQALVYGPLLAAREARWTGARTMLIGATIDPDAANLCRQYGVECFAPPFSPIAPRATP